MEVRPNPLVIGIYGVPNGQNLDCGQASRCHFTLSFAGFYHRWLLWGKVLSADLPSEAQTRRQ